MGKLKIRQQTGGGQGMPKSALEAFVEPKKASIPRGATDLSHRDLSWFSNKVAKGRDGIYSEVITITPDIARRLLEMNDENRAINRKLVEAIAKDIANNSWQMNGENIIISRDGYLNDGQHRCLAILMADKPVQTNVTFGVDRGSRTTVDTGNARSVTNFLAMHGVANESAMASLARLNLTFKTGTSLITRGFFTKQQILKEALTFKDRFAGAIARIGKSKFATQVNCRAVLPAAYYIISNIAKHKEDVELFFDQLDSGVGLEQENAVLWLRNRLIGLTNAYLSRGSGYSEQRLEAVLRYWNAWITNKSLERHIQLTGKYPIVEAG